MLRRLIIALVVAVLAATEMASSEPMAPARAATPLGTVATITIGAQPVVWAVGDSITDGFGVTLRPRDGWPKRMFNRLCGFSCVGLDPYVHGRASQCLIAPGCPYATNLVDEWQSILDANPTPTTIVLEIGRNDLGRGLTDQQMQNAYTNLIIRANDRGIRVIVGTIPPPGLNDGRYWWLIDQQKRVNTWIRQTQPYVADFAAVLTAPGQDYLWQGYDSGDGIHPGDLGAMRMADMVDVTQITPPLPQGTVMIPNQ